MPVNPSRHYTGGGLGDERGWSCPSCGAKNDVAIASGCQVCGAGKPGYKVGTEPPPPPPAARETPLPPEEELHEPNAATRWLAHHPDATLEQAFTAGYVEGVRDARRDMMARQQQALPKRPKQEGTMLHSPEARINRTMTAALSYFRDQVLAENPEEVQQGEWMSADEAEEILNQLRSHLRLLHMQQEPEAANA